MVTTREMSIFRLHGRKTETWDLRGATVEQRFEYNYTNEELTRDIVPRIQGLAEQPVAEVHVMFNNIHHGYGPSNAQNLVALLRQLDLGVVMPSETVVESPAQNQLSFE